MGALFVDGRSFQTVDSTLRQPGRLSSSMWHVVGVMLRHVFAVLHLENGETTRKWVYSGEDRGWSCPKVVSEFSTRTYRGRTPQSFPVVVGQYLRGPQ